MIDREYACTLARYNCWMNQRLYASCRQLSDDQLYTDRGAFFGSLYLTLNHILYADLAFLSRFTGIPAEAPILGQELCDGFDDLSRHRQATDRRLMSWAETLDVEWLQHPLTYTSQVDGRQHTHPRWFLVVHLFQHQVHHRGQLTTLLSQLGVEYGSTDLPFMPAAAAG